MVLLHNQSHFKKESSLNRELFGTVRKTLSRTQVAPSKPDREDEGTVHWEKMLKNLSLSTACPDVSDRRTKPWNDNNPETQKGDNRPHVALKS